MGEVFSLNLQDSGGPSHHSRLPLLIELLLYFLPSFAVGGGLCPPVLLAVITSG